MFWRYVFPYQVNINCVLDIFSVPHIIILSAEDNNYQSTDQSGKGVPKENEQVNTMEYRFTKENFETEVAGSDKPVLIDFYADWCGPCRMMGPVVEELAKEYDGKIKVGKVNVDEQPELASKFGVMSIPYFAFVKGGRVVEDELGAIPKERLVKKLEALV